jgi:restriction system protein
MRDTNLDEWRSVLTGQQPQPSDDFIVVAFPSDEIAEEYLRRIDEWPEEEVRTILRTLLGESRSINLHDRLQLQILKATKLRAIEEQEEQAAPDTPPVDPAATEVGFSEYERRIILAAAGKTTQPTWQGLTWVLDLLPHAPGDALNVVDAYVHAHMFVLPDLRMTGLSDARSIIRARYIGHEASSFDSQIQLILSLHWRDFEYLVSKLYSEQDYKTIVTPRSKDRGKDIIAERPGPQGEVVFIQCKNWRGRVDVDPVSALLGRVERERATRGVIFATSGFTRGPASATEFAEQDNRLGLVSGRELVPMLNEHLGRDWPQRLDRLIDAERQAKRRTP